MAGGKGSRMKLYGEKLLLKYKKPVILHVVDSLKQSNCFSKIIAITSNNSPDTKQLLEQNNIDTLNSSGDGYVEDLNLVLQKFDDDVFVTSGICHYWILQLFKKSVIFMIQKIFGQVYLFQNNF